MRDHRRTAPQGVQGSWPEARAVCVARSRAAGRRAGTAAPAPSAAG
ncbi:hypothetical protein BURMUCGD2M_2744 [Burkholderia multivorans CGD2M]|uniref:Uncharacterized protein n=1 Tax=Burkholderia multivorans CGD2 TaxID=513052 RepID=B9BZL3_9BURK|nr:hypothetical protein BURMUCGD1_2338 [Burkholderia multivorans CGD1]EEE03710.1 hypothetical protein BURMUCGD2_2658 [Burkholderia multivorans CGD2]EEE11001.1 hypothetical protein BURMUCGD2M_2744 [Burkholderia multivorans CGD2M]EJO56030.1 hypothetical protein BURMUCF2_0853 [Burkholderia multivorans CF2]